MVSKRPAATMGSSNLSGVKLEIGDYQIIELPAFGLDSIVSDVRQRDQGHLHAGLSDSMAGNVSAFSNGE